jgi:hypothetical protein
VLRERFRELFANGQSLDKKLFSEPPLKPLLVTLICDPLRPLPVRFLRDECAKTLIGLVKAKW